MASFVSKMQPMTKQSEARRREWADPVIRKRRCEALSTAAKKRYRDPEERLKTSISRKRALKNPSTRSAHNKILEKARASRKPTHGMSASPEYRSWDAMVQRCTNPKHKQFSDYGGRGILVHENWIGRGGFEPFFECVGKKPSAEHTLGRINNDGNYDPDNVRWETRSRQMSNMRRNHLVTIDDVTLHLAEWARRIGVSAPTLKYRLDHGWSGEDLKRPGRRR